MRPRRELSRSWVGVSVRPGGAGDATTCRSAQGGTGVGSAAGTGGLGRELPAIRVVCRKDVTAPASGVIAGWLPRCAADISIASNAAHQSDRLHSLYRIELDLLVSENAPQSRHDALC